MKRNVTLASHTDCIAHMESSIKHAKQKITNWFIAKQQTIIPKNKNHSHDPYVSICVQSKHTDNHVHRPYSYQTNEIEIKHHGLLSITQTMKKKKKHFNDS